MRFQLEGRHLNHVRLPFHQARDFAVEVVLIGVFYENIDNIADFDLPPERSSGDVDLPVYPRRVALGAPDQFAAENIAIVIVELVNNPCCNAINRSSRSVFTSSDTCPSS
jgi:hypothetical protein